MPAVDWPFPASPDLAVFICRHVQQGALVVEVTHDADGDWQFLCDADHGEGSGEEPVLVSLGEVAVSDETLATVAELPEGWIATRPARGARWEVEELDDEPRPDPAAEHIALHGWHVCLVADSEEEPSDEPDFAYSVGLHGSFGQPEVIVFGLPLETMHAMINVLGEAARAGEPLTAGERRSDVLEGHDVLLRAVSKEHYPEYVGQALRHYQGDDFALVQLLWPDQEGKFPSDDGASEAFRAAQPLLTEPRA